MRFGIRAWLKMPPRRGRAHGVFVGCGRGRQPIETDMQRDIRRLEERLEDMERKKPSQNLDNSDEEEESPDEEVRVLKMLMKASRRPRVEVPMYEGNLNVEELMDWINALNK